MRLWFEVNCLTLANTFCLTIKLTANQSGIESSKRQLSKECFSCDTYHITWMQYKSCYCHLSIAKKPIIQIILFIIRLIGAAPNGELTTRLIPHAMALLYVK